MNQLWTTLTSAHTTAMASGEDAIGFGGGGGGIAGSGHARHRSLRGGSMTDMPPITHIVLFKFKESVPQEEVTAFCRRFLALRDLCLHPMTKQPYIISIKGGKDTSPEGKQVR